MDILVKTIQIKFIHLGICSSQVLQIKDILNANHPVYCSSADWMERNLSNRIEVCFPVLGNKLANRIIKELEIHINTKGQSWELQANGEYKELTFDAKEPDVQNILLNRLAQV